MVGTVEDYFCIEGCIDTNFLIGRNDATPICRSAEFTGAIVNDGTQFKAETP